LQQAADFATSPHFGQFSAAASAFALLPAQHCAHAALPTNQTAKAIPIANDFFISGFLSWRGLPVSATYGGGTDCQADRWIIRRRFPQFPRRLSLVSPAGAA